MLSGGINFAFMNGEQIFELQRSIVNLMMCLEDSYESICAKCSSDGVHTVTHTVTHTITVGSPICLSRVLPLRIISLSRISLLCVSLCLSLSVYLSPTSSSSLISPPSLPLSRSLARSLCASNGVCVYCTCVCVCVCVCA